MAFDAAPPIPDAPEERRALVRSAVRGLLERTPEYATLDVEKRRTLAHDLVQLTETSLSLMAEEHQAEAPEPLAEAQASVIKNFDPQANRQVGSQIQDTLEGIAFPRFVTELVNGVFKGLIDANAQQMQAYVDMIAGVTSATADSGQNTGPDQARVWLVQQFPDNYELGAATDIWGNEDAQGGSLVKLREGKDAPKSEDVAAMLELEGEEAGSLSPDDPEESLLPKVRAYLSRKRQKVLASLLTLGMNRIVIDHGKIKAGMNFSIDAKSAAEENKARRHEFSHTSSGSGSFGVGNWGVSASMTNSIGMVSTKQTHQREEMNQQVNMNADVELHFHSDYLPLNQLAAADSVNRIKQVSLNPQAPVRTAPSGPTSGQKAAAGVVSKAITMPKAPPLPKPKTDGKKPEPKKPETKKPEPKKPETKKAEPAKTAPKTTEPAKTTTQPAPTTTKPTTTKPAPTTKT